MNLNKSTFIGQLYWLDDSPSSIKVIPSGWKDKYHVIVEHGDYETHETLFMDAESIMKNYKIDVKAIPAMNELIKEYPNDYDLGEEVRRLYRHL